MQLFFLGGRLEERMEGEDLPSYVARVGVFEVKVSCPRGTTWYATLKTVESTWGADKRFADPDNNYIFIRQTGLSPHVALVNLEKIVKAAVQEMERLRVG